MPNREERANVLMEQALNWLLGDERVRSETSGRTDRKLLDFDIRINGVHIVIEAKYDDQRAAEKAADERLKLEPQPHIVGALSYSSAFKKDAEKALRQDAKIDFAFRGKDSPHGWQWRSGTLYDLAQSLRRPHLIVEPEDEVDTAVNRIQGALADFAASFGSAPESAKRIADVLQTTLSPKDEKDEKEQTEEVLRMGGLILFGAFLFQFALSDVERRVKQPREISRVSELKDHWGFILEEINYVAVFKIALKILDAGNVSIRQIAYLRDVAQDVQEVAHGGTDLMGRIYHTLLADAKTLAAFYTSTPAATLMAGIALSPDESKEDCWSDMKHISDLRIVDPACGSGTLLAAACWQVRDNCARALFRKHVNKYGGAGELGKKLREVHKTMMEGGVWGYDILDMATHLTATTLGLMSPGVNFQKAHIYRTIIGSTPTGTAVGSLEMLERFAPLTSRDKQVETKEPAEPLPSVKLCIMNPPYVRGTVGNESFKFLPKDEQKAVHARMHKLAKDYDFKFGKGQGPAFVRLACGDLMAGKPFIEVGGCLAVILPAAAAVGMGAAWRKMREQVENNFHLEVVITSRDSERPAFSESTNLQEIIFVARKRRQWDTPKKDTLFVVLNRNPSNNEDALATAQAIRDAIKNKRKYGNLCLLNNKNSGGGGGNLPACPTTGKAHGVASRSRTSTFLSPQKIWQKQATYRHL